MLESALDKRASMEERDEAKDEDDEDEADAGK